MVRRSPEGQPGERVAAWERLVRGRTPRSRVVAASTISAAPIPGALSRGLWGGTLLGGELLAEVCGGVHGVAREKPWSRTPPANSRLPTEGPRARPSESSGRTIPCGLEVVLLASVLR